MADMRKNFLRGWTGAIALGLLAATAPRVKGDADIYWTFLGGFNPSTVVIGPSETVYWSNVDPFGFDLVLILEGYGSLVVEPGWTAWATFSSPGSYWFSSDDGDQGTVSVNVPPTVAITQPTDGAVFSAPASFLIEADVSETADDQVVHVEFFVGSNETTNSIADDYEAPFSASATNLAVGAYMLLAVATDSRGWSATNAIAITASSSTPIHLSAPRMAGGQFLFDAAGLTVGKTNVVQTSTNLTNWTSIKTNFAAAVAATITNAVTAGPRFFRVLQWP